MEAELFLKLLYHHIDPSYLLLFILKDYKDKSIPEVFCLLVVLSQNQTQQI